MQFSHQGLKEGMMLEHGTGDGPSSYQPYPAPQATYEEVVGSREKFIDTLKKLHASMGTKFMIPVVGGRDLDLYRLFTEVTSRGGISKVVKERKWKEVTAVFSFPSSATNASFVLRKYYVSLLYHYEQIYYFKAKCWSTSADVLQNVSTITPPPLASPEHMPSAPQQQAKTAMPMPEVPLAPSPGPPVCGVIDGKFESGYLITAKIGSEDYKGVLYQVPNSDAHMSSNHHLGPQTQSGSHKFVNNSSGKLPRRKRRKKSEIRKRDPAHPKPNRSGYNFFFAEQHAKLKPHYHGRDREISRIIGDSWNKLQEPERAVYQEKALRDKERYKLEMEGYRERLRTGQIIGSPIPIQQRPLVPDVGSTEINGNLQVEMDSDKSDKSNVEEYESEEKDSDFGEHSQADMELKNVNIEVLADEEAFDLQTRRVRDEQDKKITGHGAMDENTLLSSGEKLVLGDDGISVPIEEKKSLPCNADDSDGKDKKITGHGTMDENTLLSSGEEKLVLDEDGISVPIEERKSLPSNADESLSGF